MKRNRKIYKWIGLLPLWCLLLTACSKEEAIDAPGTDAPIILSATMEAAFTKAVPSSPAPAGTYHLGYTSTAEKAIVSDITVSGTDGAVTETGLYWMNVKDNGDKTNFTLSNVANIDGKDRIPESRDILWGADSKWRKALSFTLNHKMAQVKVTVTMPDTKAIKSVSITQIQRDIKFDRTIGTVTAEGTPIELKLPFDAATGSYDSLLPPQKRVNSMQLEVTDTDNRVYSRNLPYSMSQLINGSTTDREDVPLEFRSGYTLELIAKVTDSPDHTIQFTGATLKNWQDIGSATIPARPAGIYTLKDLEGWISVYNSGKSATNDKLKKYGTHSNSNWTFTLRRDIDASSLPTTTKIEDFSDILTQETDSRYHITGKTKEELLGSGGTVSNNVFKSKTEI